MIDRHYLILKDFRGEDSIPSQNVQGIMILIITATTATPTSLGSTRWVLGQWLRSGHRVELVPRKGAFKELRKLWG